MQILAGTSGYSYKEWKGPFYPDKTPAGDMLAFYATKLPSVEINNTFYRLPKREVLENWAEQTPEEFRFIIKASRRITHMKRLANADEETEYLLDTLAALGSRLGGVLFQLPPNLKADTDRLEAFLEMLGGRVPAAFEFRHPSWDDDAVRDLLRAHKAPLVLSDTDDAEEPSLEPTADWGYLRLRRENYDDDALKTWLDRIHHTGWSHAFVYFKHEDEAAGPKMAMRFLELAAERG